eukprot:4492285-Amphidinium_carterae.1
MSFGTNRASNVEVSLAAHNGPVEKALAYNPKGMVFWGSQGSQMWSRRSELHCSRTSGKRQKQADELNPVDRSAMGWTLCSVFKWDIMARTRAQTFFHDFSDGPELKVMLCCMVQTRSCEQRGPRRLAGQSTSTSPNNINKHNR